MRDLRERSRTASQAAHESVYRQRHNQGFTGWDDHFDCHDLDLLMASRYAPSVGRLLDVGCGGGETSLYFARRGFDVTAFDFSDTAVSLARGRAQEAGLGIEFGVEDMTRTLPFQDKTFDVVIDHRALHCIVDRSLRAATLNEIYRVLRPGGFFFSSTIAGMPRDHTLRDRIDPVTRSNPMKTRYFGEADDILEEVRAAGFLISGYQMLSQPFVVDNLIIYAARSD